MGRGPCIAAAAVEWDVARPHHRALVLSLLTCLQEATGPSRLALPHLRKAIEELGVRPPHGADSIADRGVSPAVLAAYLEFLHPELREESPCSALFVNRAIDALRGVDARHAGTLRH